MFHTHTNKPTHILWLSFIENETYVDLFPKRWKVKVKNSVFTNQKQPNIIKRIGQELKKRREVEKTLKSN